MSAGLLTNASLGVKDDIESFLAKPFAIATGQLAASDGPGTFPVIQLFKTITGLDIYSSKLKGFLGIRATVVLRLELNADRFMQGRYLLAFMPLVTSSNSVHGYNNSAGRSLQMRNNATTITQLPHVQFDVNCDTAATLEIPFISPYSHYSILTGHGDVGSYFIYPYSPLKTGTTGANVCQWTLWASLKDVELVGPTLPSVPLNSQCDKSLPPVNLTSQMARPMGKATKRGTVSEQEASAGGQGPISSVLNKVTRAADVMSQIPIISLVAKQVSWASDIMASAASVFGWSKPIALAGPMRMKGAEFPFWGNSDTVDYSMPQSMMANNSLEALPGFAGVDTDEMSIDHLKTIPAFKESFEWSSSALAGTTLWSQSCQPNFMQSEGTDGDQVYTCFTPVGMLGKLFKHYRGSFRFTFKVVKTEFHSGRLQFSYAPAQRSISDISFNDSSYLLRENLDIRMGNEFSFVAPYASLQTYRNNDDPYGLVQIHVVNELVAPSSVSNSVTVLVEVSAAPDMEFSAPYATKLTPYVPLMAQADWPTMDELDAEMNKAPMWKLETMLNNPMGLLAFRNGYNAQEWYEAEYDADMNDDSTRMDMMQRVYNITSLPDVPLVAQMDRPECSIVEGIVSTGQMFNDGLESARYCVGEKILSLSTFLKRSTRVLGRGGSMGTDSYLAAFPWAISTSANILHEIQNDTVEADYYSIICSAFALSRGGMRYKIARGAYGSGLIRSHFWPATPNLNKFQSHLRREIGDFIWPNTSDALTNVVLHQAPSAELQVPQYGKFHSRVNQELMMGPSTYNFNQFSPTVPEWYLFIIMENWNDNDLLYRSVADDFQCGYFTGFPPMIIG